MEDAAKDDADERHDEALDSGFGKLKESGRYEAGDEGSHAQIAEERCSEPHPFVVNKIGHVAHLLV